MPKRLRIFFRFDRRLLGELPGCAWRALRLYLVACFGRDDVVPGAIGFVQTAGHSGFSVHAAVRVEERQEAARLGRYMIRCPLVLERLAWDEATAEVAYSARPSQRDGAGASVAHWDVLDFLARVLDHLPEPRQQLVPYWGWYSNAARGGRRRRLGQTEATPTACAEPGAEAQSRRLSWLQLIRKVYEIESLLCTFCGATMRIVAFIVERSSLRRILQHLDGDCQQPEPLAHSPPAEAEPICAPA